MFGREVLMQSKVTDDSGFYLADKQTRCDENMPWFSSISGHEVNGAQIFFKSPELPEGIWVDFNALPIKGDDGTVNGIIAIFIDITEQVQVESHIADVRRALEQRLVTTATAHSELECLSQQARHAKLGGRIAPGTVLALRESSEQVERLAWLSTTSLSITQLMTSHLSKLASKSIG